MIYNSTEMEKEALFNTAARMCAAARTAPKAKGQDSIITYVLTKTDKQRLADTMEETGIRLFGEGKAAWYKRDADNVRDSQAVVLIGTKKDYRHIPHWTAISARRLTVSAHTYLSIWELPCLLLSMSHHLTTLTTVLCGPSEKRPLKWKILKMGSAGLASL